MPTHAEKRTLPYSAEQLYALVADVERYPEFLPWCKACRIRKREEEGRVLIADLTIGYKLFSETFTSRVTLTPHSEITVEYTSGPLKALNNHWRFIDNGDGTSVIDFYVDFEFHNPFFQQMMGMFFNEVVRRMVHAFEERAKALYKRSDSQSKAASTV